MTNVRLIYPKRPARKTFFRGYTQSRLVTPLKRVALAFATYYSV